MNYYDYSSASDAAALGAGLSIIFGFIFLIGFIVLVAVAFTIFARWVYFKKCGEAGWKAIIPVYNEITLLKTAGMNWWWIFILYASSVISFIQSTVNTFNISAVYDSYYNTYTSPVTIALSAFLAIISLAAAVFTILTKIGESINIAKRFGKSGGYAALIFFFEPIMFLVLGFSKEAKYDANIPVAPNGLFGGRK